MDAPRLIHGRWHDRAALSLDNGTVVVVAVPSLGGRVVSLVDRRSGRDWLVQGEPPAAPDARRWAAEEAVFGGAEAFGWDECLPTVAPCPDPLAPAAGPLRDHGDQWGRPAAVEPVDDALALRWAGSRWPYVLRRTIELDGATVLARYELVADGAAALPVLWSMHALLHLEPGARVVIEPPGEARLTHERGLGAAAATFRWPALPLPPADGGTIALDVVRAADAGQAAKVYLDATALTSVVARATDGSELRFAWDRAVAPVLGVWLSFGGWPAGDGRHQVALEPTTAGEDDLASAIAAGSALRVEPGRPLRWEVRLELVPAGSVR